MFNVGDPVLIVQGIHTGNRGKIVSVDADVYSVKISWHRETVHTFSAADLKPLLTDHDWLQIKQAAKGCVSGDSSEWPHLVTAIEKLNGPLLWRKSASWLQGFCEGVLAAKDRYDLLIERP